MSFIEEVAQWNNVGSSSIAAGNIEKSMKAFSHSIATLEKTMISLSSLHQQRLRKTFMTEMPNVDPSTLEDCSVATSEVSNLYSEQFYIFNHSIEFIPSDEVDRQADVCQYEVSLSASIVFFNMAIALHTLGKHSNAHEATYIFQKAMEYYDKSLDFSSSIVMELDNDMVMALIVATLNNQSSIYFDFGDFHKSQNKMRLLVDMSHRLDFDTDDDENIITSEDLNGFLSNIIMTRPCIAACA